MAIEVYWGSGSPFAWTVLLALEFKGQPYTSHLLQFSKQEHKTPAMLAMNPRGKVPVLRDGDFVVYESKAICAYLERKFPKPALFGETPHEAARIAQVSSEFQFYLAQPMVDTVRPFLFGVGEVAADKAEAVRAAAQTVREELKFFEKHYLSKTPWLAGERCSIADLTVFPTVQLFLRGLGKEGAKKFDLGFLPFAEKYPAFGSWIKRLEALPGYEKTYPPHWRG